MEYFEKRLFKPLISREKVSLVAANKSGTISDYEVLEFYNLATGRLLRGLEVSNPRSVYSKHSVLFIPP